MTTPPHWGRDDLIDSRDIIKRVADLEEEIADLQEELDAWKPIVEQGEGYGDWVHGETLIHERYFTDYAQQLAEDIGATKDDGEWPGRHIDWEAAAEELKVDYTVIESEDETYYMRAH